MLDNRRLGKQRVEALQVLDTLLHNKKAWANHPTVRMWRGFEYTLSVYSLCMMIEWTRRGFNNEHCQLKYERLFPLTLAPTSYPSPSWIGNEEFHSSHRAVLLGKNLAWYTQFSWKEVPAVFNGRWPYVWPV